MATRNALPPSWSVAGVTGEFMNRLPERLTKTHGDVTYALAPFPRTLAPSALVGAWTTEAQLDVLARFNEAAAYVGGKCASSLPCNDYFRSLGAGLTLTDLLEWRIVFYFWQPSSRVGAVPQAGGQAVLEAQVISSNATTCFAQIAVAEFSLVSRIKLAATLIHELAHIAGAPGADDDARAQAAARRGDPLYRRLIAAEMALKHCLLPKQFDAGALGVLESGQGWRARGRAIS